MNKRAHGFTIVELLVVIVVIAILAAISLVSYNGIQRRAYNTAAISSVQSWIKVLAVSYAANGTITVTRASGDSSICLGEESQYTYINPDMVEGQCYIYAHTSEGLMANISEVANVSMKIDLFDVGENPLRGIQYAFFVEDPSDPSNGTANIWYMLKGEDQDCGVVGADSEMYDGNTQCHAVINDLVGGIPVQNDDWL